MDRTTALFSAGLLLLAVVPLGTAHLTNPRGSTTSALFSDDDFCRRGDNGDDQNPDWRCLRVRNPNVSYDDNCDLVDRNPAAGSCIISALNSGVSGSYVGPATAFHVVANEFPIYAASLIVFPYGFAEVFVNALCDIEVGGSGDGGISDKLLSEEVVDGEDNWPNPNPGNPVHVLVDSVIPGVGLIPDGTWDDGGFGCAEHTSHYNGNHYLADVLDGTGPGPACDPPEEPFGTCDPANGQVPWEFNTYGCDGVAYAEDKIVGDDIWIETQCLDLDVATFDIFDCVTNDVIFAVDVLHAENCINEELVVLTTGTDPGQVIGCGNSVSSKPNRFGEGGGNSHVGVAYPAADSACVEATASVLVHNAIDLRHFDAKPKNGVLDAVDRLTDGPGTPQVGDFFPLGQSVVTQVANAAPRISHLTATVGWIDSDPWNLQNWPGEWYYTDGTVPAICAETKELPPGGRFDQNYPCPTAVTDIEGCHGGAVAVYIYGPIFTSLLTPNNNDGEATGTASCGGVDSVSSIATYGAPPWDGVSVPAQGTLDGNAPTCSVAFTTNVIAPPNSATFAYAQCFIV